MASEVLDMSGLRTPTLETTHTLKKCQNMKMKYLTDLDPARSA